MLALLASRRLAVVVSSVVVFAVFRAAAPGGQFAGGDDPTGHTISGRVTDPHELRPEGLALMLGRPEGRSSFSSQPVPVAADGSFTTARQKPGVYVLELVRTPPSGTNAASVVGQTIVQMAGATVSGITVSVRRDTALTGRFRMESDNPAAAWPSHMHVLAFVAVDGLQMQYAESAGGGANGTFVLKNVFGPRVLRCGYMLVPGSHWWPSRVLLDGRDVTNVPTDFSEHPDGQLEVVFTQHPARITGTVTDAEGRPAHMPWILVSSSDRAALQPWSTTSSVAQAGPTGKFIMTIPPGRYRVHALPASAFPSAVAARDGLARIAFGGVTGVVEDRATTVVNLTLQER